MTRIIITEGVVGGFVPAVVKRSCIIDLEKGSANITFNVKSNSDRHSEEYSTKTAKTTDTEVLVFFNNVVINGIKKLPREDPVGCEDIYHLDTCVEIHEEKGRPWVNACPQGCSSSPSRVKPTDQEKEAFKAIVDQIWAKVQKHT